MRKWNALIALSVSLVVVLAAVHAQQKRTNRPALTALDYAEIHQLYSLFAHGVDSGTENGEMMARAFAPDGVFDIVNRKDGVLTTTTIEGHTKLAAMANGFGKGPTFLQHFTANVLIEPSPEGATGSAYLLMVSIGEGGKPSSVMGGGIYRDVIVKGPQGWRFKKRTFYYANTVPRSQPSSSPPR